MKKRHGIDELSIGLVWFAIGLMLINYFLKINFLQAMPLVIVFYAIFRTISTNEIKRNSENYIFKLKRPVSVFKDLVSFAVFKAYDF